MLFFLNNFFVLKIYNDMKKIKSYLNFRNMCSKFQQKILKSTKILGFEVLKRLFLFVMPFFSFWPNLDKFWYCSHLSMLTQGKQLRGGGGEEGGSKKLSKLVKIWPKKLKKGITNKNSLFRTSNPNIFVSFQYFLLKFGTHVPEIEIHLLFSSCYIKISKTKKLFWNNRKILLYLFYFWILGRFGTPITCSFLTWYFRNLLCLFVS